MRKAWIHREPPSKEEMEAMWSCVRGRPKSEEHKKKLSAQKMGELNPSWKGGRREIPLGYIMVLRKDNPNADRDGYVLEHRVVMEEHLGRTLSPEEVVHHINEDTSDNRIENLKLFPDVASHTSYHRQKSIASSRSTD